MGLRSVNKVASVVQHLICIWHGMLRCCAIAMIATYGVWQVYWLSRGQLPPAILLAATGLPAPTTGGTRSLVCLIQGDLVGSLQHNAMTIPIIFMAFGSVAWVTGQAMRGNRARLPNRIGLAWFVLLLLAWSLKLLPVMTGP